MTDRLEFCQLSRTRVVAFVKKFPQRYVDSSSDCAENFDPSSSWGAKAGVDQFFFFVQGYNGRWGARRLS